MSNRLDNNEEEDDCTTIPAIPKVKIDHSKSSNKMPDENGKTGLLSSFSSKFKSLCKLDGKMTYQGITLRAPSTCDCPFSDHRHRNFGSNGPRSFEIWNNYQQPAASTNPMLTGLQALASSGHHQITKMEWFQKRQQSFFQGYETGSRRTSRTNSCSWWKLIQRRGGCVSGYSF